MKEKILTIDCGTQSLRAHIFDLEGHLLASEKISYSYESPQTNWAEQDPELFWEALCKACLALKKNKAFSDIAGLGLTSQRATMVCMDKEGRALRPAISWLDQRKAEAIWKNPLLDMIFGLAGAKKIIDKVQADAKCNWLMQNQAEIWAKTACYAQISGFLHHKLTGKFIDSVASQIGYIPFSYKKQRWSSPLSLKSYLFPVPREKLPKIIPAGELLGHISKKAAEETGLPEGLPIISCASDKGCETLGSGVIHEDMASLSFGTTASVQVCSKNYFEPIRFMPAYPAAIPGYYNPEVEIFRGYWMISWFKDEFAHPEKKEALKSKLSVEKLLDKLLAETPAGAMGLMLQPLWSPCLHYPDAKGSLIGFSEAHTRAHIYRALIEGLAYGLLDGLERIEKKGRKKIRKLAVSSGASQSDAICQISANIFNRPLTRGETHESSGLGAAMITAEGLGFYPDIKKAMDKMLRVKDSFIPEEDHVKLYQRLYREVYQGIYKALIPLYRKLGDIDPYL